MANVRNLRAEFNEYCKGQNTGMSYTEFLENTIIKSRTKNVYKLTVKERFERIILKIKVNKESEHDAIVDLLKSVGFKMYVSFTERDNPKNVYSELVRE